MKSTSASIAVVCAFAGILVLWPATTPAGEFERARKGLGSAAGQEVVNGYSYCDGSVFTDEQPPNISLGTFLNATSGITSDLDGLWSRTRDVPADLDAMAEICEAQIGRIASGAPEICTIGPVYSERGEFGNGTSTYSRFDFSCQGTRNEVIAAIGSFSRMSLTTGPR